MEDIEVREWIKIMEVEAMGIEGCSHLGLVVKKNYLECTCGLHIRILPLPPLGYEDQCQYCWTAYPCSCLSPEDTEVLWMKYKN